jgi:hypothetical protein
VLDQIARVPADGSFTTVDAFSRAIKQQAGQAVGIMRRKPVVRPGKAPRVADPDQIDLFDGRAVPERRRQNCPDSAGNELRNRPLCVRFYDLARRIDSSCCVPPNSGLLNCPRHSIAPGGHEHREGRFLSNQQLLPHAMHGDRMRPHRARRKAP